MIDFGKYAILDNAKHEFADLEGVYWEFRPATSADDLAMAKFYNERSEKSVDGKVTGPHWIEVMWREIAMLYGGTNMVDEDGKPVLKDKPKIEEIESLLATMPQRMVTELWLALGEAVLGWGPIHPQEENPPEESPKD